MTELRLAMPSTAPEDQAVQPDARPEGIGAVVLPGVSTVDYDSLGRGESMKSLYAVQEIEPMGYGTLGKISYKDKVESGQFPAEVTTYTAELISRGECMVPITDRDDGCIDGRAATSALWRTPKGEVKKLLKPGKHARAKVAGGGYITTVSMECALGSHNDKIDVELGEVAKHLADQDIVCGTHTGDHNPEGKTDCGANDNLQAILEKSIDEFGNIEATMKYVFDKVGLPYSEDAFHDVNRGWVGTAQHEAYFAASNGESRFKVIMSKIADVQAGQNEDYPVSTSKHLEGSHNEGFIVLNFAEGKTFSQPLLRQKLHEQFPALAEEQLPQAFVVDVPRIVQLAEAMAANRPDDARSEQHRFDICLYAGIAYQFATAATLTDGSLRTFIVQSAAEQPNAA